MLQLTIPEQERYDASRNLFYETKAQHLTLEHSLLSVSKWESKWKKPFLATKGMTSEEAIDYVRCMTITQNVDPSIYSAITPDLMQQVMDYINDPMTATTISKQSKPSREIITSELVYYWMTALNIPFECQKWHFNRLLMLIQVCSAKNAPPKKMSKSDLMKRNHSLNAARKAALHTKG